MTAYQNSYLPPFLGRLLNDSGVRLPRLEPASAGGTIPLAVRSTREVTENQTEPAESQLAQELLCPISPHVSSVYTPDTKNNNSTLTLPFFRLSLVVLVVAVDAAAVDEVAVEAT